MRKKIVLLTLLSGLLLTGCGQTGTGSSAGETSSVVSGETSQSSVVDTSYTASDYIKLGQYKDLVISKDDITVPEADIMDEVDTTLEYYATPETVTDRGVEDGDVVNIENHGYIDDKEVETLRTLSYDLEIGSGTFGQDYEAQLLGAETGDTVEFDISYSDDYNSETLAGQTVHYVVTINMIAEYPDQELTDDYVEEITDGEYLTVDEFYEALNDYLMEENYDEYVLEAAKKKILEDSEITGFPEAALEETMQELTEYYAGGAAYMDMELEEYLNTMTGNDVSAEENIESLAENILGEEMLMKAIAEAEDITLTDEEYQSYAEEYLSNTSYEDATVEDLEETYGKENLENSFILKKTSEYILSQVTVE